MANDGLACNGICTAMSGPAVLNALLRKLGGMRPVARFLRGRGAIPEAKWEQTPGRTPHCSATPAVCGWSLTEGRCCPVRGPGHDQRTDPLAVCTLKERGNADRAAGVKPDASRLVHEIRSSLRIDDQDPVSDEGPVWPSASCAACCEA